MRDLYCHYCGTLTMRIENGSRLHPKAVTICGDCMEPSERAERECAESKTNRDDITIDKLMNMFGMKR